MVGATVSHYTILEQLGVGGMGVVYKAEDTHLKRVVALKFLPPAPAFNTEANQRFIQEAQAASALDHPNICTVHEIGRTNDGQLFICMAYYGGETLKQKIARGPMKVEEAADIAAQVALGLAEAHQNQIVHRDIKPANILITKGNIAKIVDFGLAKLGSQSKLTKAGSTLGTIGYMAPEQIQGEEIDHRADLWALGVVLYEMLSGAAPFRGDHEAAVMYEILNVDPPSLRTFRSDVPDHVQQLVTALLRKQPSLRIGWASEVAGRLKKPAPGPEPGAHERSVAVLYFENMSVDKENDYFCAGMTDDIITDLSRINELKVVSRSDVLPFRNKEVNTRQVGEALHVSYILEGSVRKAGNRVRITAQLIDVQTGFHVWADRFDRLLEDIFDLQNEVSESIAGALKVSLSDSEKQSLAKKPTDDVRAHDFYMRGRDYLYRRGKKNTQLAIQMLENALALDPNYLSVYASLAEAYSTLYTFYDGDPRWLGKLIDVNARALAVDPSPLETQFAMGMVYFHQKRFREAERVMATIASRQPEHYDAFRWRGIILDIIGDFEPAIECYKKCAAIKPYSEEPWMHLEMTYRRKGEQALSDDAARKEIEVGEAKLAINPDDAITLSRLATEYHRFGETNKAIDAMKRVLEIDSTDGLALYNCACAYAAMGDRDNALDCLKKALASGYSNVSEWVKGDPDFAAYHDDPDYEEFVTGKRQN